MKKSSSVVAPTFGAAKPLPGQPGYKVSETSVLEKDAKEMESRLKMLQERMKLQQQEAEANTKMAGAGSNSRWKSSKPEKGSIRGYAKDIQEKHKKRAEAEGGGDPVLRNTMMNSTDSGKRALSKQPNPPGNYLTKEIDFWSSNDVGDWLISVNLEQYVEPFILNEINGIILLDITLEDLDYMGITVLGHRKTILKGAEDLRVNRRIINPPNPPSVSHAKHPTERSKYATEDKNDMDDGNNGGGGGMGERSSAKVAAPAKTTHWSHLEPLSKSEVTSQTSNLANAADVSIAEEEGFDEEAERKAFQEAVQAWRRAPAPVTAANEAKQSNSYTTNSSDTNTTNNMWHNPFAAGATETAANRPLKQGVLDEAMEHAEFVKAVDAWRSAGSSKPTTGAVSVGTTSTSNNNSDISRRGSASTSLLVKQLAQQLENEQEELSKRLQLQKEQATQKLRQSNLEYAKLKQSCSIGESKAKFTDEDSEEDLEPTYHSNPHAESPVLMKYTFSKSPSDYNRKGEGSLKHLEQDEVDGVNNGMVMSDEEEDLKPHRVSNGNGLRNSVAISLVESVLHNDINSRDIADESYYVVEYESDN
mmetsp:Transcript_28190/g.40143  ORF Transcript_28190/g.40143 Transcript_28190/m.40143 type:complete len:589 (+) Transcript_28190:35-1801(+)